VDRAVPAGPGRRIVVVDDASTDDTPAAAAQRGAVVVTHTRRSGAGAAIRTAIKYALAEGFDVIVVLGGQRQGPPAENRAAARAHRRARLRLRGRARGT